MANAAKHRSPRKRPGAWFVPLRGSYLPASPAGWLSYIPFIGYLVFAAVIGWNDSASHVKAVLFIVPNWVAAGVVMTWLAKAKS